MEPKNEGSDDVFPFFTWVIFRIPCQNFGGLPWDYQHLAIAQNFEHHSWDCHLYFLLKMGIFHCSVSLPERSQFAELLGTEKSRRQNRLAKASHFLKDFSELAAAQDTLTKRKTLGDVSGAPFLGSS